jgi:hypothetical protein
MDAFPNLVAADGQGQITDEYAFPKGDWKPAMWGNNYSTTANPRRGLKEFIPRCLDRGLHLGLSTWFFGPGCEKIAGLDDFVRVWDETLTFLKDNDLLHNIYYVDLLNEYPLFNGFSWLRNQMDAMKQESLNWHTESLTDPEERSRKVHELDIGKIGEYNDPISRKYYLEFANESIRRLQAKWPQLDFLYCVTDSPDIMEYTHCAALDVHKWFIMNEKLNVGTGYWENIHTLAANDQAFPTVQAAILKNWTAHKEELVNWMDAWMGHVAELGRQYGKPIGNTEGWGIINWLDHPALTWDIIKEAGLICAQLGAKHDYRFNCSSNFTHPQFPGLWQDIAWHKKVTAIIRGG